MRILINDKPIDALKPKMGYVMAKVQEEVKASVMTADDATAYYIKHTSRWFKILGGIAIALMVIIVIAGASYEPRNAPTFIISIVIIGGGFLLFMFWLLRRRIRTWNEKLPHRGEGLPPAGTQVSIDAKGLTLGAETFAWPSLSIDQVEMTGGTVTSGDTSETVHIVERLCLRSSTRAFTIDRAMMQNGLLLVDNVWRKLQPRIA